MGGSSLQGSLYLFLDKKPNWMLHHSVQKLSSHLGQESNTVAGVNVVLPNIDVKSDSPTSEIG